MKESFLSVKNLIENETIIEKSRFICSVSPVNGEDEAKQFVQSVKSKYTDATHNCYAFVADENGFYIKFSDDGEPQGTAGMPMLEVLKNRNLFKTAVVVTRYFGGIKLGAGGLVRAYSDSVCKGLDKAGIIEWTYSQKLSVSVSFSLYPKILKYFSGIKVKVLDTEFLTDKVIITFAIPTTLKTGVLNAISDYSSGKAETCELDIYYEVYK